MNELNCMVDVESLSTRSNAVIVTIAAVKFSFENDLVEEFCININPRSSKGLGLHIDNKTLDWWREQKPDAAKSWMHSQTDLPTALDKFSEFLGPDVNKTTFWFNGLSFDYPIIESSYLATGKTIGWKYWNCLDSRTVMTLAGINISKEPRIGTYHNAADDCKHQIHYLKKVLTK